MPHGGGGFPDPFAGGPQGPKDWLITFLVALALLAALLTAALLMGR